MEFAHGHRRMYVVVVTERAPWNCQPTVTVTFFKLSRGAARICTAIFVR
jgi:hypothetical protein